MGSLLNFEISLWEVIILLLLCYVLSRRSRIIKNPLELKEILTSSSGSKSSISLTLEVVADICKVGGVMLKYLM